MKQLSFRKKLQHIWNYYKPALVGAIVLLYAISMFVYQHAKARNPILYLGLVNVSASDSVDKALTDDFITSIQADRSIVEAYWDLYLTEDLSTADARYVYASQMKILASIDAQKLDVVIMDREAFDAFAQNGYLRNMEHFLRDSDTVLADALSPYLTDNIEILEDNADEVIVDPSISYESKTCTYPMGLDLSFSPIFAKAGFPEHLYLGIISNTDHELMIGRYLEYLGSELLQ